MTKYQVEKEAVSSHSDTDEDSMKDCKKNSDNESPRYFQPNTS